jgi:signal transduction histidine kinase
MQLDTPLKVYLRLTVNEYQQHCLQCLVKTVTQKREADEQQKIVVARSVKINEEEITCKKLADVVEADLKEAMPALEAAMKVVNGPMFILPGVEKCVEILCQCFVTHFSVLIYL